MDPLAADDPRQVGVYRLHARLGAGGMGRVYLGYSPGGRAVAVKVVHPELARDPEFAARFRREVRAAEAVSGVYTAPVVGGGPPDSPPWLATAFVAGPSLADLVARAGPLPEAAVWRLAGGLIEALEAIHGRGLVHRDLKPGNILIAVDGPRVIDFGISRAVQGGTVLTAVSTTIGTPAYMSPEQAEGREIGPPSDIFSFGSVIAFAATGAAPFDGGEMFSIAYRVVHAEPDLSGLPPALRGLVGGCLAKDPAGRPSLAALMDAVTAGSAAFPEVSPGKFWPDPVDALVAGQAGAVPAPEAAPATQTARPGRPAPGPPTAPAPGTAPRRGAGRRLLAGGAVVLAAALGGTLALALGSQAHSPAAPAGHTGPAGRAAARHPPASATPSASAVAASSAAVPPATAAPPPSPVAVTVCTEPGSGCDFPGGSQYMVATPKQITDSGDGSAYVTGLVWSHWGSPEAVATGIQEVDDCTPNCVQGKYTGYPATVILTGLTPYGSGLDAYSTIVIKAPASPTGGATYTSGTVP
jgi:hypothetical protein